MSSKIKEIFSRVTIFVVMIAFLVSTLAAQPVAAQGSIVTTLRCGAVKTFGVVSMAAIKAETAIMEKSFDLSLKLLMLKWQIQDSATEAGRKAAEAIFKGLLNVYKSLRAKTAEKKAAVAKFKVDALLALSLFHDDYDAAQASYREDMLALIKSYHETLRSLVSTFSDDIKAAVAKAQKNCAKLGTLAILAADVVAAKVKFVAATASDSLKAIVKATELLTTRNLEIIRQTAVLISKKLELKAELRRVMWNLE